MRLWGQDGLALSIGAGGTVTIDDSALNGAGQPEGLRMRIDGALSYTVGNYGEAVTMRGFAPAVSSSLSLATGGSHILATLIAASDGKYGAALADIPGGNAMGFYVLLGEGGLRQDLGPLHLELGRFTFHDEVGGPYTLFVNATGISSTTMSILYDDGTFYYSSRWVGLNHDSNSGPTATLSEAWGTSFPERGAVIKTYGMRHGEMRFGFQDSTVYAGRWFDYEYFLSPLPLYFSQYVRATGGVPWVTNYDDNEIMGCFWTWERPGSFSIHAQFLLDDFGLGEIIPGWPKNPWQMAASMGGRLETEAGSFGIYSAMATKYTFEPSNATKATDAYGYSYYPETRFSSYWQDTGTTVTKAIAVEDNAIGYKYGENNLAIQTDWMAARWGLDLGAALEFRLSGSNSPANPGHDDPSIESNGTRWLDDPVLEKRFLVTAGVAKHVGIWRLYATIVGGLAFDALELRPSTITDPSTANNIYIYSPLPGNTKSLFSISLGAGYTL
jgi:hypothetical protein